METFKNILYVLLTLPLILLGGLYVINNGLNLDLIADQASVIPTRRSLNFEQEFNMLRFIWNIIINIPYFFIYFCLAQLIVFITNPSEKLEMLPVFIWFILFIINILFAVYNIFYEWSFRLASVYLINLGVFMFILVLCNIGWIKEYTSKTNA